MKLSKLLALALVLMISVGTLAGSTIAWFTDEVTSKVNIIEAGTLDVELTRNNKTTKDQKVTNGIELFDSVELWEPGAVSWENLTISNEGTLALNYQLSMNATNANYVTKIADDGTETDYDLTGVLKVGIVEGGLNTNVSRDNAIAAVEDGTWYSFSEFITKGMLLPKNHTIEGANIPVGAKSDSETYGIVIYWKPSENDNNWNVNNGAQVSDYDATKNNNYLHIDLGVKLLATQLTAEADSFDNQYDADASFGAISVGNNYYESLNEAVEAAKVQGIDHITLYEDAKFVSPQGSSWEYSFDGITLEGARQDIELTFVNAPGSNSSGTGNFTNLSLKNLTVVDETFYTGENGENAWEFTYLELGGESSYEDVVFTDGIMADGTKATFTNCTFIGHNNDSSEYGNGTMYGAWVYNGEASFTKCTFKGTRGLKVGDYYGTSQVTDVVVDNCTFDNLTEKPGVALNDYREPKNMKVTIKNSTFINCQPGDQNLYIYETDNTIPTLENNTILKEIANGLAHDATNNRYYVSSADGLATLNTMMADKTAGQYAKVSITEDIDFAGKTWTPVDSHADTKFFMNEIDGNHHTIYNLTINGQAMFTRFAGFGDVTIKNLTFDNATVNSTTLNTSILTVQTYQYVLLDNVDVKNSSITGAYKVAPLIATVYNENPSTIFATLKNCDVSNTTVKSTSYDFFTTGMVSFVYAGDNDRIKFENCSITDVKLYAKSGGYDYHANIYCIDDDDNWAQNTADGVTVTNVTFESL